MTGEGSEPPCLWLRRIPGLLTSTPDPDMLKSGNPAQLGSPLKEKTREQSGRNSFL